MVNVQAAQTFRVTTALLTILVGSVGNTLSVAVMHRPAMRSTSAAVYLASLAVADTLVLFTGQVPLLVAYFHGLNLALLTEGMCKLEWFLVFTFGDAAVWLLLCLTVDRFISVQFATKARTFCTRKRAIVVCCLVFVLALLKNLHLLVTRGLVEVETGTEEVTTASSETATTTTELHTQNSGPTTLQTPQRECGIIVEEARYFETFVRPWIGFSLYAFIPIAAMLVMNVMIVFTLIKVKRVRENQVRPIAIQPTDTTNSKNATTTSKPDPTPTTNKKTKGMSGQITSLTVMFLTVSIMFLVLITPSICNFVALPYWVDTPEDWDLFIVIAAFTDTLVYLNHSINFFLYCISGRRFRAEFLAMIRWKAQDQDQDVTRIQTVS